MGNSSNTSEWAENFIIPGRIKADSVPFCPPLTNGNQSVEKLTKWSLQAEKNAIEAKNKEKDAVDQLEYFNSINADNSYVDPAAMKYAEDEAAKAIEKSIVTEFEADEASTALNSAKKGVGNFSYRNIGAGQLHIFPPFLCNDKVGLNFDKDIANSALYDWAKDGITPSSSVTFKGIMDAIPGISIREYLPDYKLDLIINLMQKFAEGYNTAVNGGVAQGDSTETVKQKIENAIATLKEKFKKVWRKMEDIEGFCQKIVSTLKNDAFKAGENNGMSFADKKLMILTLPFIFYYRMMGFETTNNYVVPWNGEIIYSTDGSAGWDTDSFGLDKISDKLGDGILGKAFAGLAKTFLGNVRAHKSPKWNPTKADNTLDSPWNYEVSFSLFNYTLEAAVNNYIFVNTIVPNNMWLLYGILLHGSSLYDVKIEGGQRMMCCTGEFEVKANGMKRSVPKEFLKYMKTFSNGFLVDKVGNEQGIIKIPDVYDVTLKFKSLLPNNFNNYLYQFSNPAIPGGHVPDIYSLTMQQVAKAVKSL